MFAYCNNNPVNMVDPTGKDPIIILVIALLVVTTGTGIYLGATSDEPLLDNSDEGKTYMYLHRLPRQIHIHTIMPYTRTNRYQFPVNQLCL